MAGIFADRSALAVPGSMGLSDRGQKWIGSIGGYRTGMVCSGKLWQYRMVSESHVCVRYRSSGCGKAWQYRSVGLWQSWLRLEWISSAVVVSDNNT